MEGILVVIRSADGPLVRRVVQIDGEYIWIATEPEYLKRISGLPSLLPVVFHERDVFLCEDGTPGEIAGGSFRWEAARPIRETGSVH